MKNKGSVTFKNCELLYCTPVTYIIMYSYYTSIKKGLLDPQGVHGLDLISFCPHLPSPHLHSLGLSPTGLVSWTLPTSPGGTFACAAGSACKVLHPDLPMTGSLLSFRWQLKCPLSKVALPDHPQWNHSLSHLPCCAFLEALPSSWNDLFSFLATSTAYGSFWARDQIKAIAATYAIAAAMPDP